MAKSSAEVLGKLQDKLAQTFRDLPAIIGEEAVNFTLENFEHEGFQGDSFEAWQRRKNPTAWGKRDETDRALLVKTAKLKRSIRISKVMEDRVFISAGGEDIPYAKVHNEGFEGEVTQNVAEHIRKTKTLKNVKVSAFTRKIYQQIPKRKFIGGQSESSQLRSRIQNVAIQELNKILKP